MKATIGTRASGGTFAWRYAPGPDGKLNFYRGQETEIPASQEQAARRYAENGYLEITDPPPVPRAPRKSRLEQREEEQKRRRLSRKR